MSKYAAAIRFGWLSRVLEGDSPCAIMRQLEEIQDFDCLLEMGRMQEGASGQQELDKLEEFLEKYRSETLTMQDIADMDISLRAGPMFCYGVAEGEEEVAELKAKLRR